MTTYNSDNHRELLRLAEESKERCTLLELEARMRAQECERTVAEYGVNSKSAQNDASKAANAYATAATAAQNTENAYIAYYRAVYGERKETSADQRVYFEELAKP